MNIFLISQRHRPNLFREFFRSFNLNPDKDFRGYRKRTLDEMYHSHKKIHGTKSLNPLSANPTKWSNTLKQFVSCCRQIVLSVFDHFMGLALKVLPDFVDNKITLINKFTYCQALLEMLPGLFKVSIIQCGQTPRKIYTSYINATFPCDINRQWILFFFN